MDLSKYTFTARACASKLDEIESKLGIRFDRKALFGHEQSLLDQSRQGPRLMGVRWTFEIGKTGSGVFFFTSRGGGGEGVKECGCGEHVELTSRELGYGTNALECALDDLDSSIPKIQTLRQQKPAQEKQMTTQDKETIMHETVARASLVAFAEFIGQPINDLDATFKQARALYGNIGSIACVVKIPVDKTKPIVVTAVDGGPISDGVALQGGDVVASYYLWKSDAKTFRSCTSGLLSIAPTKAIELLTTERAKQTPPPPAKSEPIPYESECRAYVKRLNKELGINLNEDAVLAAGEVARATYKVGERPSMNYVLSVARASRVASFAVLDKDAATPSGVGLVVISTRYYPSNDGLQCALRALSSDEKISKVQSELTPPAPSKPAPTVASIRRQVSDLEGKLGSENQPPIFVFNGRETYNNGDDSAAFLGFLTSGAASLFLTFENRASRRIPATKIPRVHVHTSPTPFLPEFNTTISAPIDPANPAATLTALAERITAEKL